MKNSTIIIGTIILLVIGGYFVFANTGKENINVDKSGASELQGVQKVVLSIKNLNYYPNEIRVKANQPVSISLDKSVTGCFRSFTIRDLGIYKSLPTPSDTVDFTPTKAGTYTFACSMGMGYGKLIVE